MSYRRQYHVTPSGIRMGAAGRPEKGPGAEAGADGPDHGRQPDHQQAMGDERLPPGLKDAGEDSRLLPCLDRLPPRKADAEPAYAGRSREPCGCSRNHRRYSGQNRGIAE